MTTPTPAALKAAQCLDKGSLLDPWPNVYATSPETVQAAAKVIDSTTSLPLLLEIAGAAGEVWESRGMAYEQVDYVTQASATCMSVSSQSLNKLQSLLEQLKKGSE